MTRLEQIKSFAAHQDSPWTDIMADMAWLLERNAELLESLKGLLAFNSTVSGSQTHRGNFHNWKVNAEQRVSKAEE